MSRPPRTRSRVARAAAAVAARLAAPASDAAWVVALEGVAGDPRFTRGRDFGRAVAAFRAAVAAAPIGPPPAGFEPALGPADRYERWCRGHARPAVDAALAWAAELLLRALDGTPPVSDAEFGELAAWVRGNEPRLRSRADAAGLVPLGDGTGADLDEVLARFGRGPRWPGAAEAAEIARRLRGRD